MDQPHFSNPNSRANRAAGQIRQAELMPSPSKALLLLVVMICLSGCASPKADSPKSIPPTPVSVAVAKEEAVPIEVTAVGTVEPSAIIQVRSRVSGELTRVSLIEGSEVHQGDLLFEIDPRPYNEALRQAEAAVAKDTAQLKQAEANVVRDQAQLKSVQADADRSDQLLNAGVVTRQQRDQGRSASDALLASIEADRAAIESARASIENDRSMADRAKLDLDYCKIRSPITGRVGNLLVHEGNLVSDTSPNPLVIIHRVQPIWVSFGVPEEHLEAIRKTPSQNLLIRAAVQNSSQAVRGTLIVVDNTVDTTTGTIKLKANFENQDRLLWPGQFVNVTLTLGTLKKAVIVPAEAVQPGQKSPMVYVVKPDQTVEPRTVVVGQDYGKRVIIEKGLAAGESVVTDGQLRLFPGAPVRAVAADQIESQKL
ncbi:MAG: efflux transporter, family, subunit [Bryobacterales bacterium]|nr:efflux transporter, family, subunit [Bryobacterales bacterium]